MINTDQVAIPVGKWSHVQYGLKLFEENSNNLRTEVNIWELLLVSLTVAKGETPAPHTLTYFLNLR